MYAFIKTKTKRKASQRRWWVRPWLATYRRLKFGIYDQLMAAHRREGIDAFESFTRMPPEMYDEVLARVAPRISKKNY